MRAELLESFRRSDLVHVALCLPTYTLLMYLYFIAFRLDESAYASPLILAEISKSPGHVLLLLGNLAVLIFAFERTGWKSLEAGRYLRLLTLFVAAVLAWRFSCIGYNFYFDQAYLVDRAMLVVLVALIWIHPLFVAFFLILCVTFAWQLEFPVFHYSFTDKRALFDYLVMLNAFTLLRTVFRMRTQVFLLVALSSFAAAYFVAGTSKLLLGPDLYSWILENSISNLFVSSYQNGWLAFLPERHALGVATQLARVDVPLALVSIAIELGAIFILFGKRISLFLLAAFFLMHLGIMAASGIFFWKWMLLGGALALLLVRLPDDLMAGLYTARNRTVSVVVVLLSFGYLNAVPLGWYDSRINNFYSFDLVDSDGERTKVRRTFFAPYDLPFAQNRFYFLSQESLLANTYGSVFSAEVFQALEKAGPSDVEALRRRFGTLHYDGEAKARFGDFLRVYLKNRRQDPEPLWLLDLISPPHHILGFDGLAFFPEGGRIEEVEVVFHETFYDGEVLHQLRNERTLEIDLR
ncbi:MAG: hypothetical protein AAEJ53_06110 [Myxococcota bacterium]